MKKIALLILMQNMFYSAKKFNQNLNNWNLLKSNEEIKSIFLNSAMEDKNLPTLKKQSLIKRNLISIRFLLLIFIYSIL